MHFNFDLSSSMFLLLFAANRCFLLIVRHLVLVNPLYRTLLFRLEIQVFSATKLYAALEIYLLIYYF